MAVLTDLVCKRPSNQTLKAKKEAPTQHLIQLTILKLLHRDINNTIYQAISPSTRKAIERGTANSAAMYIRNTATHNQYGLPRVAGPRLGISLINT
jgi:hypothetical protein